MNTIMCAIGVLAIVAGVVAIALMCVAISAIGELTRLLRDLKGEKLDKVNFIGPGKVPNAKDGGKDRKRRFRRNWRNRQA